MHLVIRSVKKNINEVEICLLRILDKKVTKHVDLISLSNDDKLQRYCCVKNLSWVLGSHVSSDFSSVTDV